MRITVLTSTYWPPRGGIEHWLGRVTPLLAGAGHTVHIVNRDRGDAATVPPPAGTTMRSVGTRASYLVWPRSLRQAFMRWRVRAAAGHADVWLAQQPQDLRVALDLRSQRGGVVVALHHGTGRAPNLDEDTPKGRRQQAERAANRRQYADCDAVVCVSEYGRRNLAELVAPDRLFRVANGADAPPTDFPFESVESISPVFGYIGRLHREKGLRTLLRAWELTRKRLPGAKLLIAGSGPMEPDVRSAAAADDRLEFRGWVSGADRERVFADCHATILVSEVDEGMPLGVLESLARGRPVLSTASGGAAELVIDGRTGWVTPKGDADAMAERLCDAACECGDAVQWQALSRAGRAHTAGYTWENCAKGLLEVIDTALGRQAR